LVRLSSDAAAIQCGCAVVHLKAVADKHLLLPVLPSSVLPSPAASASEKLSRGPKNGLERRPPTILYNLREKLGAKVKY
jgi:hypothetical protein